MDYVIYSIKMNAWISTSWTGTSDFKEAKLFTRAEAVAHCRKHKSAYSFGAIPVNVNDMVAL